MFSTLRKLAFACAIVGLTLGFAGTSAKADVEIFVNGASVAFTAGEPNPPVTAFKSGPVLGWGGNTFNLTAATVQSYEPPVGSEWAQTESTTITLQNTGATADTLTLDFVSSFSNVANVLLTPGFLIHRFSLSSSSADLGTSLLATSTPFDSTPLLIGGAALSGSITGTTDNQDPLISPVGPQAVVFYMPTHAFGLLQNVEISMAANTTMQFILTSQLCNVPEPSSMAIAGLGALGLVGYGIRRRRIG